MKQQLSLALAILALVIFSSCDSKKTESETQKEKSQETVEEQKIKKDCKDVHWSHQKGEDGPENWKNLCAGFSDCGGKTQSPVNFVTKEIVKENTLTAPEFSYRKSNINIINNLHTIQFNISGDNKVDLNGKEYKLLQFHYHALSEHTIDGKYYPIEVHFVHQHSDTDFAVLGIMFEEGEENKLFAEYLDVFPTAKGEINMDGTIDLLSLFPDDKSYFNYKGSLTTPPCSEVVNWYVLKTPVTASIEQIEKFSKILKNNYRPIQPLNERTIKEYSE